MATAARQRRRIGLRREQGIVLAALAELERDAQRAQQNLPGVGVADRGLPPSRSPASPTSGGLTVLGSARLGLREGVAGYQQRRETVLGRRVNVGDTSALRGQERLTDIRHSLAVARTQRVAELMRAARSGQVPTDLAVRHEIAPEELETVAIEDFAMQNAPRIDALVSRLSALTIDAAHYSGLTVLELLNVLESQGRPFLEVTSELRDAIATRLREVFARREWDEADARDIASGVARDQVDRRFAQQGADVSLAPLDPDYAAAKSRAGFGSRIGIRTGALRAACAADVEAVF